MSNGQLVALIVTVVGAQLAGVYFTVSLLLGRIDRVETALTTKLGVMEERLFRHLEYHVGKDGEA